jgi:predicted dehydrogenase
MTNDRRTFIKQSATIAAAVSVFPTLMNASCVGANEKVVIALIGCNNQGWVDLLSFMKLKNVECAALCDVDENVLNKRAAEFEKMTGKKPALFTDFRKVLEKKEIDAVIVGTPDHWHCIPMIYAMEAGKDVYCEKPVGYTIEECNLMVKATQRYKKVVQVGQWQRSDPHWLDAVKYIQSGNLGRVRSVRAWSYVGWKKSIPVVPDGAAPAGVDYNMWLGPRPERPFNSNRFHATWRWYWDYAGGVMTDWGVHLLDYALFGMNQYVPKAVSSNGGKYAFPDDAMETPDTMMAMYDFGGFGILWDHTIGIYGAQFKRRGHGVAFIGEYGTLIVDRSGWEVMAEQKSTSAKAGFEDIPVKKGTGNGLDLHTANFIDCIKTRNKPNCDIEIGAHIARFSQMGNIAYRLGRKIVWDAEKQEFLNDPEANALTKATYRAPWSLPKV